MVVLQFWQHPYQLHVNITTVFYLYFVWGVTISSIFLRINEGILPIVKDVSEFCTLCQLSFPFITVYIPTVLWNALFTATFFFITLYFTVSALKVSVYILDAVFKCVWITVLGKLSYRSLKTLPDLNVNMI